MKTERRHELQNNELAFFLANFIEKYRSQAGLFGGLALLGIAAWLAMSYMSKASEQANAGSWSAYFQATETRGGDERQFNAVADTYGDTNAGNWARFSAATSVLSQATQSTFTNREDAKAKLKVAKEQFESLVNVQDEILRPRAMLGLAQTLESLGALGGGESLDEAAAQYQSVIDNFPDTEVGRSASDQLNRLKNNRASGWYTWFASQQPAPDPLSTGSGLFDDIGTTPADPNVSVPAVPGVGSLIRPDGADTAIPIDLNGPDNAIGDDPLAAPVVGAEAGDAAEVDASQDPIDSDVDFDALDVEVDSDASDIDPGEVGSPDNPTDIDAADIDAADLGTAADNTSDSAAPSGGE